MKYNLATVVEALTQATAGTLAGRQQAQAQQRIDRQQLLENTWQQQRIDQAREQQEALTGYRREALTQRGTAEKERAAAAKEREARAAAGRMLQELTRRRRDPELQGWFQANPGVAQQYDDEIERTWGMVNGTTPFDQFSPTGGALPAPGGQGAPAPTRGQQPLVLSPDQVPGGGPPLVYAPGMEGAGSAPTPTRFPVDVGAGRTIQAPDIPPLEPGRTFRSPHGGTVVPTPPGGMPGGVPTGTPGTPGAPAYETPKQRAERLRREAQEHERQRKVDADTRRTADRERRRDDAGRKAASDRYYRLLGQSRSWAGMTPGSARAYFGALRETAAAAGIDPKTVPTYSEPRPKSPKVTDPAVQRRQDQRDFLSLTRQVSSPNFAKTDPAVRPLLLQELRRTADRLGRPLPPAAMAALRTTTMATIQKQTAGRLSSLDQKLMAQSLRTLSQRTKGGKFAGPRPAYSDDERINAGDILRDILKRARDNLWNGNVR